MEALAAGARGSGVAGWSKIAACLGLAAVLAASASARRLERHGLTPGDD